MSWGEPQQPPYDPRNPYGQQQQPYQQGDQPQQGQPGAPSGWGQPSNSGSGYTQPMPDQGNPYGQPQQPQQQNPFGAPGQPYGQQQYGQPYGQSYGQPYGQPTYGQPAYTGFPAPPPKKGNATFVALLVGGLVVVGGGIAAAVVLTGNHSSNPVAGPTASVSIGTTGSAGASSSASATTGSTKLTAPTGVQGLTLLSNSVAQQDLSSMKTSLAADAELYPDPVLAAYNDGGGSDVTTILVDQAMSDLSSTDQTELTSSGSAANVVSQIMTGAGVSNAQTETTDASDGALSCGTKDESGTNVTICVWYDQSTFGTLQYLDGTTPSTAAPVADAMRAAAES
ncbi:hypothetical protein KDK95_01275 [Actinospica sp. MGRD01-02]|uniref:Uncharacterized protein n=1 Tax=Actinospica acidithermotolerans TaxID=2828514 RepID=A0A941IGR2_9ACTN|nr:hypothetical protein [Actinospica acidithermotolerans]MBR7824922.1 hypothetical protein [Actinospica acidithermotolerans]